jgi:hypothetical protein
MISRTEKLRTYLLSINKESVADWIDEHVEESLAVLALPLWKFLRLGVKFGSICTKTKIVKTNESVDLINK